MNIRTLLDSCPRVSRDSTIGEAFTVMNYYKVGFVYVLGDNNTLLGIFTDGDFRRLLSESSYLIDQLFQLDVIKHSSLQPTYLDISNINDLDQVSTQMQVANLFTNKHIYDLPVLLDSTMIGSINIQNLLQVIISS